MANPEHVKRFEEGVKVWNDWREQHPDVRPDLSSFVFPQLEFTEANLSAANLRGADFRAVRLRWPQLRGADLSFARCNETVFFEADFRGCCTHGADFSGATLHDCDLRDANFSHTNFSKADLNHANAYGAIFKGSNLSGVCFLGATLAETDFGDVNLTGATHLETCAYVGPSVIDYRTLAQSGSLPLEFLRGCGLPDTLIDYIPSLVGQPIQFYSCFISYSNKDAEFAVRLHADLQDKGVRCWFAPHDVKGGKKLHEQIDEAIRVFDRLLLILSENSMNSEWVKTEIARARKKEISEGRQVLFPVRLVTFEALQQWKCFDANIGKDSAREIREYFIPDFSQWEDHDSYQPAFDRLVLDLKATVVPKGID